MSETNSLELQEQIPSQQEQNTEELDRVADRSAKKTFFRKKKGCHLCLEKKEISYKDPDTLNKFTSMGGRILSMKITGICTKHQRQVKKAIKFSRNIAILPF